MSYLSSWTQKQCLTSFHHSLQPQFRKFVAFVLMTTTWLWNHSKKRSVKKTPKTSIPLMIKKILKIMRSIMDQLLYSSYFRIYVSIGWPSLPSLGQFLHTCFFKGWLDWVVVGKNCISSHHTLRCLVMTSSLGSACSIVLNLSVNLSRPIGRKSFMYPFHLSLCFIPITEVSPTVSLNIHPTKFRCWDLMNVALILFYPRLQCDGADSQASVTIYRSTVCNHPVACTVRYVSQFVARSISALNEPNWRLDLGHESSYPWSNWPDTIIFSGNHKLRTCEI